MESRLNEFTLIRYLHVQIGFLIHSRNFVGIIRPICHWKVENYPLHGSLPGYTNLTSAISQHYQHCKHWRIKIASCAFQKNIGLVSVWSMIITLNISRTLNSLLQHCTLLKCLSTSHGGSFQVTSSAVTSSSPTMDISDESHGMLALPISSRRLEFMASSDKWRIAVRVMRIPLIISDIKVWLPWQMNIDYILFMTIPW